MAFYDEFQAEVDKLQHCRDEAVLKQIQVVIAVAERHGDADAVAEWQHHLLHAASNQGRFDYELAAFSALRRMYDTDPRFKDLRDTLLWYYKWIVERLPEHVEIPLELIETMFGQMTDFYKAEGESLRPVYALRCRCFGFLGDKEQAERFYQLWQTNDATKYDDCAACQTHAKVEHLLSMNKPQEAIDAAQPLFEGKESCEEVPIITFARLLFPLMATGNMELTEWMHKMTIRPVRNVRKFISHLANHVVYLSLTGRAKEATRLAWILLGRGTHQPNAYHRLTSWRGGWVWATLLAKQGDTSVRVPKPAFPEAGGQPIDIHSAVALFRREALSLSEAFDERSHNPQFAPAMLNMEAFFESMGKMS